MVYIIVLNYNGWRNTIECVESVLKSTYKEYRIVIVDNASIDDSLQCMKMWAEGKLNIWLRKDNPLYDKSFPLSSKPLCYCEYNYSNFKFKRIFGVGTEKIVFINSDKNRGYAGGNNVGMKFSLKQDNCNFIWILNNDVVISSNSLYEYINYSNNTREKISFVGCKQLYYYDPKLIQSVGGSFMKQLSLCKNIGTGEVDRGQYNNEKFVKKIDYITGSSVFLSKGALTKIGLMCEDYFLFYEEIDWSLRAKSLGFKLGYCYRSVVYHKEGATTGTSFFLKSKNDWLVFLSLRNRIMFAKNNNRNYLFLTYIGLLGSILKLFFNLRFRLAFKVLESINYIILN